MHSILSSEHGLLVSVVELNREQPNQVRVRRRWTVRFVLAAVLLLAFLPFAKFILGGVRVPKRGPDVAIVSHSVGASFEYGVSGETTTLIGANVPTGEYRLLRGITELTYDSGVKVTVEAPASFLLVDQKTVELFEGKLSAHVPTDGIGFTVHTPRAAVVDFGHRLWCGRDESRSRGARLYRRGPCGFACRRRAQSDALTTGDWPSNQKLIV